jgi:hypothetical protein
MNAPIKKGDTVCYKGNRKELAVVAITTDLNYGQGRLIPKAMIIWITGPKIGKRNMFDLRDLIKIEKES